MNESKEDVRDYPAERFAPFLRGRAIEKVEQNQNADEGLILTLSDGSVFSFGFSGCEGFVRLDVQNALPRGRRML